MDRRTDDNAKKTSESPVPLQPISTATARSSTRSPDSTRLRVRRPTIADRRQPSIRLRRLPSASTTSLGSDPFVRSRPNPPSINIRPEYGEPLRPQTPNNYFGPDHAVIATDFAQAANHNVLDVGGNRRRSSSEPRPINWDSSDFLSVDTHNNNRHSRTRARGLSTPLSPLEEGNAAQYTSTLDGDVPQIQKSPNRPSIMSRASTAALSALGMRSNNDDRSSQRRSSNQTWDEDNEYENRLVDILDVVDPGVATLSTLTNVQNSLFVPDLGPFLNRRPTYTFQHEPKMPGGGDTSADQTETEDEGDDRQRPPLERSITVTSNLPEKDDHYAVLPHGTNLRGWTPAEIEELNDHVRHMLHSRRAAFKRGMKGFGQYVRRPLGFFVTVYAFLITVFGLVWVLFLIGWISVEGRQRYDINVIDNVLVALFAVIGDGLAPFRAIDTYHMGFIAHYTLLTWRLRRERNLPDLEDPNDLPGLQPKFSEVNASKDSDEPESPEPFNFPDEEQEAKELVVLTPVQQARLKHHQEKFSKSHTFYKPHETLTHRAFSVPLLIAIVVLLDCHSLLQIALGTCTWSISYHVRPFALTTVILCCSITCNITGGVLISVGDHRSRKKDVVERLFRQELTQQAIRKIEKRRKRELERNQELEQTITPDADTEAILPVEEHVDTSKADQSKVESTLPVSANAGVIGVY